MLQHTFSLFPMIIRCQIKLSELPSTPITKRKKQQIFSLSPSLHNIAYVFFATTACSAVQNREDTYSNVERHTDSSSQRPRMGSSLVYETGRALIHYLLLSFHLKSNQQTQTHKRQPNTLDCLSPRGVCACCACMCTVICGH